MGLWPNFIILLGQRRSEIVGVQWAHLDLASAEWKMPPGGTNNAKPHVLPLPQLAVGIIKGCPRVSDTFVFRLGATRTRRWQDSRLKKELDEISGDELNLSRSASDDVVAHG